MSENKNLEIIKQHKKYIWESSNGQYNDIIDEIELSAERMAKRMDFLHEANVTLRALNKDYLSEMSMMVDEIRSLKAELEKYNTSAFLEAEYAMISKMSDADKMDLISRLLRVNNNLFLDNTELKKNKAELEKRPEVVRCVECCSIQHEYSQDEDGRIIAELLVCGMSGRPIGDSDFCSMGQRKESEEK